MKAAVVTAFDTPPRYEDIDAPNPAGPADFVVDVVAAGLHPRVRSQADGSHYTSTDELPLIPGIDGVGRGPDRRLRYFVLPDTTQGAMAERTVVDERRSILLPEDADVIALAAAMNPAMSSWVALRRRIDFRAGRRRSRCWAPRATPVAWRYRWPGDLGASARRRRRARPSATGHSWRRGRDGHGVPRRRPGHRRRTARRGCARRRRRARLPVGRAGRQGDGRPGDGSRAAGRNR